MNEIRLSGKSRNEFGKGAARRLRNTGQVPAVLYGHGTDPIHLSLPAHDTQLALRQANALLSITIDDSKAQLALPKQVQRDPIKNFIEHVDLVIVKAGEKVQVEVPITLTGETRSGIAMLDLTTLTVQAPATNIPAEIQVSVEDLEAPAQLLLSDVTLPEGVEAVGEDDLLVVNIAMAPTAEELEADLEGSTEGEEEVEEVSTEDTEEE